MAPSTAYGSITIDEYNRSEKIGLSKILTLFELYRIPSYQPLELNWYPNNKTRRTWQVFLYGVKPTP